VIAPVKGGAGALMEALRQLDAADIAVHDVALRRPSLDDVFLTLTGNAPADAGDERATAPVEVHQ
jgi:ABC-2 type transport system ATP-binding protein